MNNKFEYIEPVRCIEDLLEHEPCLYAQKLCYCESNKILYVCDGSYWREFADKYQTLVGFGTGKFYGYDPVPDSRLINWLKS